MRMVGRDIVVIGASAGGLRALKVLLEACPPDLPAAVLVVMHRQEGSLLPGAGARWFADVGIREERVVVADDGLRLRSNRVYIAPSDRNMVLDRGRIRLEDSPREHLYRPAINPLFRSAALTYGRRVVGVILTGALDDGTAGLWEVKRRGGVAVVQDPHEAEYNSMPRSALDNVKVDYCVSLLDMGPLLGALTARNPPPPPFSGPRPANVVIVEDEAIVALNLQMRLEELGYRVRAVVRTGEEAVEAAGSSEPDLVLMDIRLPGAMDGTEAARAIWERYQVPVIYVTAYADDETLDKVRTTEAYGYIVKPFKPAEVHAAIQVALERRERELNEILPG
jgi:two-component system chemotaxis response regulator CheB